MTDSQLHELAELTSILSVLREEPPREISEPLQVKSARHQLIMKVLKEIEITIDGQSTEDCCGDCKCKGDQ